MWSEVPRALRLVFALLLMVFLPACRDAARGGRRDNAMAGSTPNGPAAAASHVTPVAGPSWLAHLGFAVSETRLGQMGGTGPQPGARGEEPRPAIRLDERLRLTGADLYRLECRSCHGPAGRGAPPEIPSLREPIQAISDEAPPESSEARGTPAGAGGAKDQTSQTEADLGALLQGGGKMPSFERLRGDEVEALLGYLQELAGVDAGKRRDLLVTQSVARVGEHLVKGTCHVCHDATGPGGHHATMMSGIIPSLASFPEDDSLDSVLFKVERGSSGMMGMMGMMRRGEEMPAFPYLSQEEVTAAYLYLEAYPPGR